MARKILKKGRGIWNRRERERERERERAVKGITNETVLSMVVNIIPPLLRTESSVIWRGELVVVVSALPSQSLSSSYWEQSFMPSHRRDQGCWDPSKQVKVVMQVTGALEVSGDR